MLTGTLPPVSNLATWRDYVELTDADDSSLVDMVTDVDEITISLRDPKADCVVLSGTLSDGTVITSDLINGNIEFVFSASQMSGLAAGTYELGCLVKFSAAVGGDTEQIILGTVPVVRGL